MTYAKSLQIHNTTLNATTHYLLSKTNPAIGSNSPAMIIDPGSRGAANAANASDVIAYATLEGAVRLNGLLRVRALPLGAEPGGLSRGPLLFVDRPVIGAGEPPVRALPAAPRTSRTCR